MALTDLTRISTSGIATGTSLSGAILHGDAHFRGSQVGVTSALFDSSDDALEFNDNVKLKFGNSGDLSIYHTGGNTKLEHSGGGHLQIKTLGSGEDIQLMSVDDIQLKVDNGEFAVNCVGGAQVDLYHHNNIRVTTTDDGAVVTGILTATSFSGPLIGSPINNPSGISTFYDLRVSNNLTVEGSTSTLDTTLIGVDRVEVGANSNTVVGVAVTQSGTADIVNLFDGATKVVTVDGTGKVGLGSAIPAEKLDVLGTIQCLNELRSKSGNDLLLNAGSANRDVKIQVNDVNMMYVQGSTGKVGIGTDNPTTKLQITDTSATILRTEATANDGDALIQADGRDSSGNLRRIMMRTDAGADQYRIISSDTTYNLALCTGNAPRVLIAGNSAATSIGGSNVFNAMLTVQGDISGELFRLKATEGTSRLMVSGTNTNGIEMNLYDEAGGQKGILGVSGTEFFIKAPNNSAPLTFYTHNGSSIGERLRIDSSGKFFFHGTGATGANNTSALLPAGYTLNVHGTNSNDGISVVRYSGSYGAYGLNIGRSRNDTFGTNTAVQDGDELGHVTFYGADGTNFDYAAQITGLCDGAVGTGGDATDMPGALSFRTTPDGSDSPTERLRIDSSGRILIAAGAVATPKASVGGLDVSSGIYSIIMGGETNVGDGTGRRNSYQKEARLGMPHYTNAEEPFGLAYGVTISGENRLNLGGGSSIVNAATSIKFYTAANTTTTGGTERLRITSAGQVSISGAGTTFGNNTLLNIAPTNRTTAFSASDGDTWHDVVLKQTGDATTNAVGIAFEVSSSAYHKNAGTGICAVKNGTASDYGSDLVFITRPQSAVAAERLRIKSGGQVLIGTNSSQSFNGVGQNHNLIVTGDSNDTDITDNHNAAITISNEDGTANNTAGLHFAREDTDGNPHYTGASVVAQFLETMNTGHYPKADLAFLTSTANNNAPSEKMRLKADGEVRLTSGGFVSKTSSLINLSVDTHGWSQNTFYDVIGSNVFDSYTDTFLVQFQWEHEGHGSPYLAYGNFLFTPTGANHTGAIGRTFQPVQCGHSFHGPTKYFEFRAYAAGAVRPGIQAVARGFSPANSNDYGYMRIKATRIASN